MNLITNENSLSQSTKSENTNKNVKNKTIISEPKRGQIFKTFNENIKKTINKNTISNIIKLDLLPKNNMQVLKIEYSKDKTLLDRLFQIKNLMSMKKKTFI